jgi:hypothetical protein
MYACGTNEGTGDWTFHFSPFWSCTLLNRDGSVNASVYLSWFRPYPSVISRYPLVGSRLYGSQVMKDDGTINSTSGISREMEALVCWMCPNY